MRRQLTAAPAAFPAFRALVFARVNIHVATQHALICKSFRTLSARVPVLTGVSFHVVIQMPFGYKSFVTQSAQKRF